MRALISALLFLLTAQLAAAQNLGIQFSQMPVGTKMYYKDFEGDTWTDMFNGRSGSGYLIERRYDRSTYSSKW